MWSHIYLGSSHWVFFRQKQFKLKNPTCIKQKKKHLPDIQGKIRSWKEKLIFSLNKSSLSKEVSILSNVLCSKYIGFPTSYQNIFKVDSITCQFESRVEGGWDVRKSWIYSQVFPPRVRPQLLATKSESFACWNL